MSRNEGAIPQSKGATAFIGLGSNEGRRLEQLRRAVRQLDSREAIVVVATSPVYASEAHTLRPRAVPPPPYLNAVVQIETTLSPEALLTVCHRIERAAGRDRSDAAQRWAPRPIDLDVLTYEDYTCDTPTLTLPHPRLGERRFVLQPWADIAPNQHVPPPFDASVQALLERCSDTASLHRTSRDLAVPSATT